MATDTPSLDTKTIHGLAEPEEFVYPNQHELWTPANYDSFNISKGVDLKDKSASKNVPAPKETPM